MSKLSELIKETRLQRNVSQKRLAMHLGLRNEQYISNFERNLCYIPYKYIGTIAQRLSIPIEQIEIAIMLDERDKFRQVLSKQVDQVQNTIMQ